MEIFLTNQPEVRKAALQQGYVPGGNDKDLVYVDQMENIDPNTKKMIDMARHYKDNNPTATPDELGEFLKWAYEKDIQETKAKAAKLRENLIPKPISYTRETDFGKETIPGIVKGGKAIWFKPETPAKKQTPKQTKPKEYRKKAIFSRIKQLKDSGYTNDQIKKILDTELKTGKF